MFALTYDNEANVVSPKGTAESEDDSERVDTGLVDKAGAVSVKDKHDHRVDMNTEHCHTPHRNTTLCLHSNTRLNCFLMNLKNCRTLRS